MKWIHLSMKTLSQQCWITCVCCRSRSLRSPANMFVINLAITDLLMCITQTPTFFITSMHKRWIFGEKGTDKPQLLVSDDHRDVELWSQGAHYPDMRRKSKRCFNCLWHPGRMILASQSFKSVLQGQQKISAWSLKRGGVIMWSERDTRSNL